MEYATLPGTDLSVSRLAFGCEPLGGTDWGAGDHCIIARAVEVAVECGINLFDTADVYGLGKSEERLAAALGARRSQVVIATKFGVAWQTSEKQTRAKTYLDTTPERVVQALHDSLRRLNLDCIPLFQIHWPDGRTPLCETLAALEKCRDAGKIRYIGCSNFSVTEVEAASQCSRIASVQVPYSITNRGAEQSLLPACGRLEIGTLAYGVLAQGLLSGKYGIDSSFTTEDRRSRLPHFRRQHWEQNTRVLRRLEKISRQYGRTPSQIAIRWVLDGGISSAIVGIKSPAQLLENLDVFGWQLSPADRQYIIGDTAIDDERQRARISPQ